MTKHKIPALVATFIFPATLMSACGSETAGTGQLMQQPPEVEASISVSQGTYKPVSDQIKALETALEKFSEKSRFRGYYADDGLVYEISNKDFYVIEELQTELQKTHTSILGLLADPKLNPNGRFSAQSVEVTGSIGDTEKSMASIVNVGADMFEWRAEPDVIEDCRRLHHELQALRADISGVANSQAPKTSSSPAPKI